MVIDKRGYWWLGICLQTCSLPVLAGGFGLSEQSASGMGSSFASGGAAAEDASTMFFNPASMTVLQKKQLVAAGHLIVPSSDFSNDNSTAYIGPNAIGPIGGNDGDAGINSLVPNAYLLLPLGERMRAGLGVNVPFGSTSEYDDDWVGRYHGVHSSMRAVNVNPAFSFQLSPSVSVGAGVNMQYVDVKLTSAIDLGSLCVAAFDLTTCNSAGLQPMQDDGYAVVTGDNWGYGWNAGVLMEHEGRRFSLAYRSSVKQSVDGKADFSIPANAQFMTAGGTQLVDTGAHSEVTMPASLSASWFVPVNPSLAVMADVTVTRWSSFQELRISYDSEQEDTVTYHQWADSWRYALGARYRLADDLQLRVGAAYDKTPLKQDQYRTVRIPTNDFYWLSAGGRYNLSPDFWLDFAYGYITAPTGKVDNALVSQATPHRARGSFETDVHIVSAQATWNF
ncbi:MAG: outer membrane protein transport protein [Gammaproteobacteria bacterium]|nr:outer membrane protein transport protein [Gammaproteobacteria bacterium]